MVLDAAFELFLEHGYEGTSMEAVARAVGVTKPVIYACYPSKEELFNALLRREEDRVLTEIAAALPAAAEGDLGSALTGGLIAFLRAVEASPRAYRVIFLGEGANAAVAHRIQRGRERQVEAVSMLARPLLGDGETTSSTARRACSGTSRSGSPSRERAPCSARTAGRPRPSAPNWGGWLPAARLR